jgi:hypothetical protein
MILRKREAFPRAFAGFEFERVARSASATLRGCRPMPRSAPPQRDRGRRQQRAAGG